MRTKTSLGLLSAAAALTMGVALLSGIGSAAAAAKTLTVDLASSRGPSTGVGEGFLYGMNQDASLPADQYLQPLGVTAWRAGGHLNRAWIGDGYRYGSQTQADVNSVITQARRLTRSPYHAQAAHP